MNERQQEILDKVNGLTIESVDMKDGDFVHLYFEGGMRLRMETYVDPIDPFNTLTDLFLEEKRGLYNHYHEIDSYDAFEFEDVGIDIPDDEKEF